MEGALVVGGEVGDFVVRGVIMLNFFYPTLVSGVSWGPNVAQPIS